VRHGPGHNVAIYHRDPDGHLVEMFYDLDCMVDEELGYYDPRPWHRHRPQRPKVWVGLPRDVWGPADARNSRILSPAAAGLKPPTQASFHGKRVLTGEIFACEDQCFRAAGRLSNPLTHTAVYRRGQ
jgi:hypothetical protein